MRKILCILGFLLATVAYAQVSNPSIISVTVAPTGSCAAGLPNQQVVSTGVQYSCQNVVSGTGTWGILAVSTFVTADVTSAPYNASGFIAKTTLTATAAIGATSFSVASTTGFYPGDVVIIALGGTSGTKDYAGFIATASGTTLTINNTAVSGNLLPPTATSGTTGLTTSSLLGYQVYSVATTTTAASAVSGATSITLANASSYLQNQGLLLFGCGAAGVNQLVTISSVSGNNVTITPGIANASGCASGSAVQHDDTAAFQAAINLVTPQQSAKILVPDGYYQINPPTFTNTLALSIPCFDYYSASLSEWLPQTTLEITGQTAAPQTQSYLASQVIPSLAGAIIATTLNGNFGADSLIGAPSCTSSYQNFTNVQLLLNDLTFRTYPNPRINVLKADRVESLKLTNSNIDTGDTGQIADPTSGVSTAILAPAASNGSNNLLSNLQIIGYSTGIQTGEHLELNNLRIDNNRVGMFVEGGQSIFCTGTVSLDSVPFGLVDNGGISIYCPGLNIEHQGFPAWAATVWDIQDPGNNFTGEISFNEPTGTPVIQGATNIRLYDLSKHQSGVATLSLGTVTVSTSGACTPGQMCNYQLQNCGIGGTVGTLSIGTVTAGTSFVINSSSNTDTSQVCWRIN